MNLCGGPVLCWTDSGGFKYFRYPEQESYRRGLSSDRILMGASTFYTGKRDANGRRIRCGHHHGVLTNVRIMM